MAAVKRKPFHTQHIKGFVEAGLAAGLYDVLAATLPWHDGVRSRSGPTRLAYQVVGSEDPNLPPEFWGIVVAMLGRFDFTEENLAGVYINYYRDGNDFTPNHSHPGTIQAVLSLGGVRTLQIAKKNYRPGSGDLVVFGPAVHGVPKDPAVPADGGRISVALFISGGL